MYLVEFLILMNFINFWLILLILANFKIAITFDGDVLSRWFLNRWKALTLSFPKRHFSMRFDLRKASKSRFRSDTSDFTNSSKITKFMISTTKSHQKSHFPIFDEFLKSEVSLRNRDWESFLRSKFNKKISLWKAESQGFPSVEESASEDITIEHYGDCETQQNLEDPIKYD